MLEINDLYVYYGPMSALKRVSISVAEGELVTVIGANGAGKTTLMNTISGLLESDRGTIEFMGRDITGMPAHSITRLGIIQIPEGRGVFPEMTVLENLEMGAYLFRDRKVIRQTLEQVYSLFPILEQRGRQMAGTLSGGEQQMLAIGRGLMSRPKLLLLDEPSQGLSPLLVQSLGKTIEGLHKDGGLTILLVEQNVRMALEMADRGYVLQSGEVILEDKASALLDTKAIKEAYLGV
jgi:branched-chain amino acid transport system ATP-binding protein